MDPTMEKMMQPEPQQDVPEAEAKEAIVLEEVTAEPVDDIPAPPPEMDVPPMPQEVPPPPVPQSVPQQPPVYQQQSMPVQQMQSSVPMPQPAQPAMPMQDMKFCQHCGTRIPKAAVICTACGCQVEVMQAAAPNIIVNNNNANMNQNINTNPGRQKDKWVAFLLCFFFGWLGAHKFYEGKPIMGILYLLTLGGFTIGWALDTLILLCKPNPYYV